MSNTKETQAKSKLVIFKNYTAQHSTGVWLTPIYYQNGTLFCKVNGDTKQESLTNAKQIVKVMNMHDELIKGLRILENELMNYSGQISKNHCKEILAKLLKQAEKK